jgi:hypothetical protein
MAKRANIQVTSTTPVAIEPRVKTIRVAFTDSARFEAFVLPKGSVICGAYIMGTANSGAVTSAVVTVGTGGAGTELINAYNVKTSGAGYYAVGSAAGAHMGTQLAADTLYNAVYTGVGGGDSGNWLVKVEYYSLSQGFDH